MTTVRETSPLATRGRRFIDETTPEKMPRSSQRSSHSTPYAEGGDPNEKPGSCCSCRRLAILLLFLIVAAGLTWYLLPDDRKDDLPQVSFPGNARSTPSPTFSSPDLAPTHAPTPEAYKFMQCQDPTSVDCCQGLDGGVCNLRTNEIVYAYMHNAVHTKEDGFLFPWNHDFGLEKALEAGFRALELDVARCGENQEIVFYHSSCTLGTRDVTQTLQAIGQFMDQNPTEVIVLFLQMKSDGTVLIDELDQLLRSVPTVHDRMYDHLFGTVWPTLGEMVATDQRVVLFYWNQPSCDEQTCPSGWHAWRNYGIETPWDFQTIGDVDDFPTSCAKRFTVTNADFYRVNAFVQFPGDTRGAAETLNSYDYAEQRAKACATVENQTISFYGVDFWRTGDIPRWVQDTNRARATGTG